MTTIIKLACLGILVSSGLGCASQPSTGYTYDEVVIINQTRSAVSDVAVAATESGRMFSCGNIAPRGICSNKFPPQPYAGKPLQVTWMIGNGTRHTQTILPTLPASFLRERPLRGVLVIDARGQISAHLQQDVPGPHR